MMRARRIAVVAAIIGALAFVGPLPAGADADTTPDIAFSVDGRTWSAGLPAPLFDEEIRWVPGDARTASFSVRNDSGQDARMQVDIVSTTLDALIRVGDLFVEARVDGQEWRSTSEPGVHELSSTQIDPGGVRTVDVRVTLPRESTNISEALALDFDLRVTLGDVRDPGLPDATSGPPADRGSEQAPSASGGLQDAGALPMTGGALPVALSVVAAGMVGAGALATIRGRSRRPSGERSIR